jgi:lipoate-protein ligase B
VASIGIHLQHRITSHGFAMNLTQEPIPWFDLVTACGLTDVRATSIHDMLKRLAVPNGTTPRLPSVRDVAGELIPRFGEVYKREMRDLADGGESELKDLVHQAEESAVEQNKSRGWPSEPDLSKRT